MDAHLLQYAERPAPRYTSYPSANHFDASVNADVYGGWLKAVGDDTKLSLYLHVPYCRQLCWYCGCNTFLTRGGDIADFVATLTQEIDLVASALGSRNVNEVHWGGGTPNVLSANQFLRLAHRLDFWFDILPGAKHAIELDPRYVTAELAQAYAAAGVTRVSLGIQDLNAHVQEAIGRVQPIEQVRDAVAILRDAGLNELSFDLMYGLPHQSYGDLAHTIKQAAALTPNRIALFGYAHVPWFKRRQRLIDANALPGAGERYDQADLAARMLGDLGYESIGLDHFARADDPLAIAAREKSLSRNFQGYVDDARNAVIGFGPSAISQLPQGYSQNIATIGAWRRAVEAGSLPVTRGHVQNAEDMRRSAVIQQLMCNLEVDLAPWGGWDSFPGASAALAPLAADGIVEIMGEVLKVPSAMRQFLRVAALAFDAYAPLSSIPHSRAV